MAVNYVKQSVSPVLIQSCINAPDVSPGLYNFFLQKQIPLSPFGLRNDRAATLTGRINGYTSLFSIDQLLRHQSILTNLEIESEELDTTKKRLVLITSIALGILLPWGVLTGLTFRIATLAIVLLGVGGSMASWLKKREFVNHQSREALMAFLKNSELFTQKIIGNGTLYDMLINREKYLALCSEAKGSSLSYWQELNALYTYLEAPPQQPLRQEAKTAYEQVIKEREERKVLQAS
ncbi:MAG: hypothetical protein K2X08_07225 [Chlamydiales bacterium]|nr:hypothetical protein [Chlamydiales bacterium]